MLMNKIGGALDRELSIYIGTECKGQIADTLVLAFMPL